MAKLMVIGEVAQVEITRDPLDGDLTAKCQGHIKPTDTLPTLPACDWSETYDDMNDAVEFASDHADGVR